MQTGQEQQQRREVRDGVVAMLPFIAGYVPFALTIGAVAAQSSAPLAGWAGSWLVYGGSAHLVLLREVAAGAAVAGILTALVVHARLAVYAASLRSSWSEHPRWFRIVGGALLIEPTWALALDRAGRPGLPSAKRAHHLGAGLALGCGWSLAMAVGVLAGSAVGGRSVGLEATVPLCSIAMLAGRLRSRRDVRVTAAAVAVAALLQAAPAGASTLAAIAAGVAVGARSPR